MYPVELVAGRVEDEWGPSVPLRHGAPVVAGGPGPAAPVAGAGRGVQRPGGRAHDGLVVGPGHRVGVGGAVQLLPAAHAAAADATDAAVAAGVVGVGALQQGVHGAWREEKKM